MKHILTIVWLVIQFDLCSSLHKDIFTCALLEWSAVFEKNENKQKEAGLAHFLNKDIILLEQFLSTPTPQDRDSNPVICNFYGTLNYLNCL